MQRPPFSNEIKTDVYLATADKDTSIAITRTWLGFTYHGDIHFLKGYSYKVWNETHGLVGVQGMFITRDNVKFFRTIYLSQRTCKQYLTI
jgi:hypothetical protein